MTRRTTLWAVLALLGIVVSAALAWTAGQLATQPVGLSGEPLSVAAGLAPPAAPHSPAMPNRHRDYPREQAQPSSAPATPPTATAPTRKAPSSPVPATTSTPAAVGSPPPAPATAQASAANAQPPAGGPPTPVKPLDDSGGNGGSGGSGASGSSGSQGPDD